MYAATDPRSGPAVVTERRSSLVLHRISGCVRSLAATLALAAFSAAGAAEGPDNGPLPDEYIELNLTAEEAVADLPAILERRFLRVLVSYNQTNYFLAAGEKRGFEYELTRQYEKHLNKKLPKKGRRMTLVYVPVPFAELIPALLEGRGDLVAAGMTATERRAERVSFSKPYLEVDEVVVGYKGAPAPKRLEDLSGKAVFVLRASSYAEHLRAANRELELRGKRGIIVVEVDPVLQTEDVLEMVSAGILDYAVADEHLAKLWAEVLPGLRAYPEVKVNSGGKIAWAVRKENPMLLASVDGFLGKHRKGTLTGNVLFKRYFGATKWVTNPVSKTEREKFEAVAGLLKKYGDRYGFDWLVLAAQAYQESKLDHSKVSPRGAVGVMQVLPATAADPKIGIKDVRKLEDNIHAGVKYLDWLRDRYFSDDAISEEDRVHFAHAAYNAGPRNVIRMRNKAKEMGLDPNRWFGNVEWAALRVVGREPVRYVANIKKYYVAYRLSADELARRRKVKEKWLQ